MSLFFSSPYSFTFFSPSFPSGPSPCSAFRTARRGRCALFSAARDRRQGYCARGEVRLAGGQRRSSVTAPPPPVCSTPFPPQQKRTAARDCRLKGQDHQAVRWLLPRAPERAGRRRRAGELRVLMESRASWAVVACHSPTFLFPPSHRSCATAKTGSWSGFDWARDMRRLGSTDGADARLSSPFYRCSCSPVLLLHVFFPASTSLGRLQLRYKDKIKCTVCVHRK